LYRCKFLTQFLCSPCIETNAPHHLLAFAAKPQLKEGRLAGSVLTRNKSLSA
jgi:hypothetical protein